MMLKASSIFFSEGFSVGLRNLFAGLLPFSHRGLHKFSYEHWEMGPAWSEVSFKRKKKIQAHTVIQNITYYSILQQFCHTCCWAVKKTVYLTVWYLHIKQFLYIKRGGKNALRCVSSPSSSWLWLCWLSCRVLSGRLCVCSCFCTEFVIKHKDGQSVLQRTMKAKARDVCVCVCVCARARACVFECPEQQSNTTCPWVWPWYRQSIYKQFCMKRS